MFMQININFVWRVRVYIFPYLDEDHSNKENEEKNVCKYKRKGLRLKLKYLISYLIIYIWMMHQYVQNLVVVCGHL